MAKKKKMSDVRLEQETSRGYIMGWITFVSVKSCKMCICWMIRL